MYLFSVFAFDLIIVYRQGFAFAYTRVQTTFQYHILGKKRSLHYRSVSRIHFRRHSMRKQFYSLVEFSVIDSWLEYFELVDSCVLWVLRNRQFGSKSLVHYYLDLYKVSMSRVLRVVECLHVSSVAESTVTSLTGSFVVTHLQIELTLAGSKLVFRKYSLIFLRPFLVLDAVHYIPDASA